MNITSLADIRRGIIERHKEQICPKCEHKLTIEKTEFFETEICEGCLDYAVIKETEKCCNVPVYEPFKMFIAGGGIQVRNQCINCGFVEGKSLGGLSPAQRESLPEIDQLKRDARDQAKFNVSSNFHNQVRWLRQARFDQERNEKNSDWWKQYNSYLQSNAWKEKRERVLKRDQYKCQSCLTGLATQVHHKSYSLVDFKGSEPCFDLVSICTPCHDLIHKKNP